MTARPEAASIFPQGALLTAIGNRQFHFLPPDSSQKDGETCRWVADEFKTPLVPLTGGSRAGQLVHSHMMKAEHEPSPPGHRRP